MIMFLFIVLILLAVFLVMIVLLQRGRGAGLAGAFGSGGGTQSAFGTKTGDVFTTVTVVAFVLFMLLSIGLFMKIKWNSIPDDAPAMFENVSAQDITDTSAKVVWTDKTTNLLGYRVSRSEGPTDLGKDASVFDVPADQTMKVNDKVVHYFADTTLTPGTEYTYVVQGWNGEKGAPQVSQPPLVLHVTTTGVAPLPVSMPATLSTTPSTTTTSSPAGIEAPSASQPAATPATGAPMSGPATAPSIMGPMPPASTAPATGTKPSAVLPTPTIEELRARAVAAENLNRITHAMAAYASDNSDAFPLVNATAPAGPSSPRP